MEIKLGSSEKCVFLFIKGNTHIVESKTQNKVYSCKLFFKNTIAVPTGREKQSNKLLYLKSICHHFALCNNSL